MVKRKTAQGRLSRALKRMAPWCRGHRHRPVAEPQRTLVQELRGQFASYGITGHGTAWQRYRDAVVRIWRQWLARRRRRGFLSWATHHRLWQRFPLPRAVAVHSVYRRVSEPLT